MADDFTGDTKLADKWRSAENALLREVEVHRLTFFLKVESADYDSHDGWHEVHISLMCISSSAVVVVMWHDLSGDIHSQSHNSHMRKSVNVCVYCNACLIWKGTNPIYEHLLFFLTTIIHCYINNYNCMSIYIRM